MSLIDDLEKAKKHYVSELIKLFRNECILFAKRFNDEPLSLEEISKHTAELKKIETEIFKMESPGFGQFGTPKMK